MGGTGRRAVDRLVDVFGNVERFISAHSVHLAVHPSPSVPFAARCSDRWMSGVGINDRREARRCIVTALSLAAPCSSRRGPSYLSSQTARQSQARPPPVATSTAQCPHIYIHSRQREPSSTQPVYLFLNVLPLTVLLSCTATSGLARLRILRNSATRCRIRECMYAFEHLMW